MGSVNAPLRFLIVEDEALLAMDLEMLIEDAGHVVIAEAASLRDVQRLAESTMPDIALVDLHLAEGSSGFDVCAHVQEHWPEAIIIFVTANLRKLPEDYAGAHGAIAKPFSRTDLISAMRYIEEGMCDPPPSMLKPDNFMASPALALTWSM